MWTKLDDGFTEHPKVVEAGALGLALHVSGMVYVGRNLTDGYVPESVARRLVDVRRVAVQLSDGELFATYEDADKLDLAADLVAVGLWHDETTIHDCAKCLPHWPNALVGYYIHDYLEFNPTRAKVMAERAAAKERREKGKRASGDGRANVGDPAPAPAPAPAPKTSLAYGAESIATEQPKTPNDMQTYLISRLMEYDEEAWCGVTPGALTRLNGEIGRPAVTTALQHAWEERLIPTGSAYGWLKVAAKHAAEGAAL